MPDADQPASLNGASSGPVQAVLFDFHGTLAQVEDEVQWVIRAAETCGVALGRQGAADLAARLVIAGRAGGPLPEHVPSELAELFAARDLSEEAHRAAYTGLAALVETEIKGLPDALYERMLLHEHWYAYADTVPTLRALRAAGIPVALVSNIGFEIRPLLHALGIAPLLDATVLSYQVGYCKPDRAIFQHACKLLGVAPERALMVGDTPADAGAVAAGCSALILPAAGPEQVNGLSRVLTLAGL